mgnify:FL=1
MPPKTTKSAKRIQSSDDSLTPKGIESYFKSRIETAKINKKTFIPKWKHNVELRIGSLDATAVGTVYDDNDGIAQSTINPDWALTKTKTANLFSQVPVVQGTHENTQYAAAVFPFMKQLNYEIGEKRANIGVPMEEVLNDAVNAAGIAGVYVGYAARFVDKTIPALEQLKQLPPEVVAQLTPVEVPEDAEISPEQLDQMLSARQMPMKRVQQVVSDKIFGHRVSPSDLLWPAEFTGSNFDDGDWIGHRDQMSWAEGKNEFRLTDDQKETVLGSGTTGSAEDELRVDYDRQAHGEIRILHYDEIFYWRYRVDPEEKHFKAIWRLVFVDGIPDPVIHEAWKGQKFDKERHTYVGASKFPIRILTLTYITDNSVPPSDTAAGRPQVNDMRRSRSQMFMNRERSIPMRWGDVNRLDPLILQQLLKGNWQGIIPTNGDGSRVLGEVARASYPAEDSTFDQQAKADLMETWQIGPNQQSQMTGGTATEANTVQQNFATRIGQERNRVAAFFLSICEIIAGYMVLYSEFPILTDQERQTMRQAWDQKTILHDLVLKIRPDSQIVLDVSQHLDRLFKYINMTAKSGYVNIKPLLTLAAELSGIDPSEVIVDPTPTVEEPQISYRFSSKDDLMSPAVVAILAMKKQLPSPKDLDMAKQFLLAVQQLPQPVPAPTGQPGPGVGPDESSGELPPSSDGPPGQQQGVPPPTEEANPDWNLASKIASRSRDAGIDE